MTKQQMLQLIAELCPTPKSKRRHLKLAAVTYLLFYVQIHFCSDVTTL